MLNRSGDSFTYANSSPLSVFTPNTRRTIPTSYRVPPSQIVTSPRGNHSTLTKNRRIIFHSARPNTTNNIRHYHRRQLRNGKPIPMTQKVTPHRVLTLPNNPLTRLDLDNLHDLFNRHKTRHVQYRANNSVTRANPTSLNVRAKTGHCNRRRNNNTTFRVLYRVFSYRGTHHYRTIKINLRPSYPKHNYHRRQRDTFFRRHLNNHIHTTPNPRVPHHLYGISTLQLFRPRQRA